MRLAVVAPLLALGCSGLKPGSAEHGKLVAAVGDAPLVGADTCAGCHEEMAQQLGETVHAKAPGCEACHGHGGKHAEDPPGHIVGAGALRGLTARGRAEMCLACHGGMTAPWAHAPHAGEVGCAECHSDVVHYTRREAARAPGEFRKQAGFCEQCHAADVVEFRQPFHHPVPEGAMTCTDCHQVHRRDRDELVLEEGERCRGCHPREAGPRVFRHAALDEGCDTCHDAHGSPLPALLRQAGNNLCLHCHFDPGFPVIQRVDHGELLARGARCWDCHTEVHGSNSDPTFLGRLR